jgi:serine/threonine-protein phosphatase CPPED1
MTPLTAPTPRPDEFTFVLLADRTGLARPGVFERAVDVTNLLRPDFAIQVGDTIEGYTTDLHALEAMWDEIDAMTAALDMPLYRVPGNHDIGNLVMRDAYARRNGPLHGHFCYRDVLFVMMDTQDPPQSLADMIQPVDPDARAQMPPAVAQMLGDGDARDDQEVLADLLEIVDRDPSSLHGLLAAIKGGTQPARISDEQADELEQAIRENADVNWTFVIMHIPAWQGEGHPALDRLHAALGDRPYTVFAGHCHNYQRTVINGRDHIRLGATGGVRLLDTDEGDWDHVTAVTVTPHGPRIANIVLSGVIGVEGGTFTPVAMG